MFSHVFTGVSDFDRAMAFYEPLLAGLVSMGSYMLLALPPGEHGAAVQRVFWADMVGIVLLALGWWLSSRDLLRAR